MKTINKILIRLFLFLIVFLFNVKTYSQDSIKNCNSYESLYKIIKEGKSASINKTAWIQEFRLVEKSIAIVEPVDFPLQGYKVTYKILDIEKGKKKDSNNKNSVLGLIMKGCDKFNENYETFINTSCYLFTDTPEDARDAAKNGINIDVDNKYSITGDLVTEFEKLCRKDDVKPRPVKKPAVYLYPIESMNISVKLEIKGHITVTEPLYNNGWNVNVTPDGLIDNKYDYLFYEANLNKVEVPDEGWVVEYGKLENWFNEYLPKLGLNTKEKEQFKEYWLKNLRKANYYEIKLLDNKFLSKNMNLIISPAPETIIRLNFNFKQLFENREITNPVITTHERKGFTVVEWGGINEGGLINLP